MCQNLWKIKHLVKISPITFPNGFPDENDLNGSFLKENGEFWITKRYVATPSRTDATEAFKNNVQAVERLDGHTLRKDSRKKWNAQ